MTKCETIWKYSVPILDAFGIDMPKGAKILSLHTQNGEPNIWVLVNPNMPIVRRNFAIFGTGHSIKSTEGMTFIGTFLYRDDNLVFHVFEIE